jgi:hypothetical protein
LISVKTTHPTVYDKWAPAFPVAYGGTVEEVAQEKEAVVLTSTYIHILLVCVVHVEECYPYYALVFFTYEITGNTRGKAVLFLNTSRKSRERQVGRQSQNYLMGTPSSRPQGLKVPRRVDISY